ncbi:8690_t:CDS:2 [Funneliformis mosseae]|uniref:8690_t:CDS:1 n=1 Tax=Funneliformis mosseae TaxID=27381 RepID=A0A9N9E955_FUNMO|nr:8690_t:CDS:2 [Funneliformis mosseae]
MSNVRVYLKLLYTPQSLQLELQLRTLKNLLESISEDKPVPFVIIQRIQKEIDNIKDFIRFHKLRLTIEEILEYVNNKIVNDNNPDPSCTECYPITEQPSEAFENFWYFWIVYAIKGEQFNSITVRAIEKALTLEENSEALGKYFELIIQSIRYQSLAQELLESSLADLKSAWHSYLEFDCWEFETSVKSGTNSKNNSKGTSRRTSRKSSNASKMDGDTFNVDTSTSNRRISENQAVPHRE